MHTDETGAKDSSQKLSVRDRKCKKEPSWNFRTKKYNDLASKNTMHGFKGKMGETD